MAKLYDAMENASRERGAGTATLGRPVQGTRMPRSLEEKLLAMYQRVETTLPGEGGKAIQFVGFHDGVDSSRLASAFARAVSASLMRRTVLLGSNAGQKTLAGFTTAGISGWEDVVRGSRGVDSVLSGEGDSMLRVGQLTQSQGGLPSVLSASQTPGIFDELRRSNDLIVVDAPPIGATWDAVLISKVVDGTVFVVDATKTRWQAVRSAMEQIDLQRGATVGVLLNKQRFYIPRWIYNKLL